MTTIRKIVYSVLGLLVATLGLFGWCTYDTWRKLPEAYAAWDIGTILICYMERNENRWPRDWNDLASTIKPDDDCVFCRSVVSANDRNAGYPETLEHLKKLVRIDWNYVPEPGVRGNPVTTIHGEKFTVTWEGAEPNEMIHNWVTNKRKDPR